MEIEKSAIWSEVSKIQASGYKTGTQSSFSAWSMIIHTTDLDFYVNKVVNVDIKSDFVNNISDIFTVSFSIAANDYKTKLYPYVKNLEATIIKTYLPGYSTAKDKPVTFKQRFKMVFLPGSNIKVKGTVLDSATDATASYLGFVTAHAQLVNRGVEPLRLKTFSGVIRGYKNDDILRSIIPDNLNKILVDGKPAISNLDVINADNQQPSKHVIIPSGTTVLNLPTFIHEKMNGLYNAGVGTYVTTYNNNNTFFVYPTHDINKTDATKPTLNIFAVPENKLGFNDVTYRIDGKSIYILGHTLDSFGENADTHFMNSGVGFRMANAKPFMEKPVDMTADGPVGSRAKLNYEVATEDRADNFNYAPKVVSTSSNNPFVRYSEINKKSGNVVRFVWQSANDTLLYPAMPVILYTTTEMKVVKYKGTLISVDTVVMFEGTGVKDGRYRTTCVLSFYVESKS